MQKINCKITMLFNERTRIEIRDSDAAVTFAIIELTPIQLALALSRLVNVECVATVQGLEKVGKNTPL